VKPKRSKKSRHIVARSITLRDTRGKMRIRLDAGNGKDPATISVFGDQGRFIEISSSPEGSLLISLRGRRSVAALAMTPKGDAGLDIRDRDGRPGTLLGSTFDSGEHHLVIFRNGKIRLSTSKPPAKIVKG
jgi:hypothetical protein